LTSPTEPRHDDNMLKTNTNPTSRQFCWRYTN
jgi:hypothetical protein